MATMNDVARVADVSIATVSHVINGTRFVSAERAERVHAAMQELGYTPDATAPGTLASSRFMSSTSSAVELRS